MRQNQFNLSMFIELLFLGGYVTLTGLPKEQMKYLIPDFYVTDELTLQ